MKIRILSFLLVLVMAFTVMSLSGCLKGDKAIVEASPKISQNVMANSDRPASGSVVKASGTETEEAVAVSTHTVATKDELDVAISNAADGDIIKLTADIESNAVIAINRAITLDLGGYKLTTTNGWGGLQLKNGCSVRTVPCFTQAE